MSVKPIGYYGCYCHPFNSWDECHRAAKQVFSIGQTVRHRCIGAVGVVESIRDHKGYVTVSGHGLEHVQNLIPEDQQRLAI